MASTHALAQATMKVFETRAPRRGIGEAERERENTKKRGRGRVDCRLQLARFSE